MPIVQLSGAKTFAQQPQQSVITIHRLCTARTARRLYKNVHGLPSCDCAHIIHIFALHIVHIIALFKNPPM